MHRTPTYASLERGIARTTSLQGRRPADDSIAESMNERTRHDNEMRITANGLNRRIQDLVEQLADWSNDGHINVKGGS